MRIWRDIPRFTRFSQQLSQAARANAKVQALHALMTAYHAVNKQLYNNLPNRRNQLLGIAQYILHTWPRRAAPRAMVSHALGFSTTSEADRKWLHRLAKRAAAKADYITLLMDYYEGHQQELNDPSDLWRRILEPQRINARSMGITPENMLEMMDPAHRDFDVTIAPDDDGLDGPGAHQRFFGAGTRHSALVVEWIHGTALGQITAPLWVWLEASELCLHPLEAKAVRPTKYLDVDHNELHRREVFCLRHEPGSGRLDQSPLVGTGFVWGPFDTQWVHDRLTHKGGRNRTLAYIWNLDRDIFAYPHLTMPVGYERHLEDPLRQDFHHSSFNSGQDVRCAGMIGARGGLVTYLDNDSGHYRPSPRHLAKLVRHLRRRNLFAHDAVVRLATGAGAVPVDQFLNAQGGVSLFALLGEAPPPPMMPPPG